MKKVVPLVLTICFLFSNLPLLAQSPQGKGGIKVFEIVQNPNHYLHVLSADTQGSLATVKYPSYFLRAAIYPNKILLGSKNFNLKGFGHADFYGGIQQSLSPSLTVKNQGDFRDSEDFAARLNFGVNANVYLFQNARSHFRLFGGVKYVIPIFSPDVDIALTSPEGASTECNTNVQSGRQDPSMSWDAATDDCKHIHSRVRWLNFILHYGASWRLSKSFLLSAYATNPLEYTTGNYILREEPTINVSLGWIYSSL